MAYRLVPIDVNVTSVNGSTAYSPWFHVGGHTFNVLAVVPASTGLIETSSDKLDIEAEAGTLATGSLTAVTTRSPWMRVGTTTDTSAPRTFRFRVNVWKEQDS